MRKPNRVSMPSDLGRVGGQRYRPWADKPLARYRYCRDGDLERALRLRCFLPGLSLIPSTGGGV